MTGALGFKKKNVMICRVVTIALSALAVYVMVDNTWWHRLSGMLDPKPTPDPNNMPWFQGHQEYMANRAVADARLSLAERQQIFARFAEEERKAGKIADRLFPLPERWTERDNQGDRPRYHYALEEGLERQYQRIVGQPYGLNQKQVAAVIVEGSIAKWPEPADR